MCISTNTRWEAVENKAALRGRALAWRKELSPRQREEYSRRICEHLRSLPELQQARTVMSYMAMRLEVDLSELHEALWVEGVRLCFPVTRGQGCMEAVACGPSGPWKDGPFGVREPAGTDIMPPAEIDAVLVPCVAFDAWGTRLGHGGGYYDRFLPRCPRAVRILAAFEAQRLVALPRGVWDMPVPVMVTEQGVFHVFE